MDNKDEGVDGISTNILNIIISYIKLTLEHIFNSFIEKGDWPKSLKVAEGVLIWKSSSNYFATNYRPISLISKIAKPLERIIHVSLINFFDECKILSENQFVFGQKRLEAPKKH